MFGAMNLGTWVVGEGVVVVAYFLIIEDGKCAYRVVTAGAFVYIVVCTYVQSRAEVRA